MTPGDVARVLAAAAGRDNRTIGDSDVLAWHQDIGDLNFGDALEAVSLHYRETTDRLMPAHVRRLAHQLARARLGQVRAAELATDAVRLAIERGPVTDRSEEVTAMVGKLREILGDYDRTVLRRQEWVREERRQGPAAEPNPHFRGLPPPGGLPPRPSADQPPTTEPETPDA
jgi:hypothetical protein